MTAALEHQPFISPEDYLEGEKSAEIRHEYILGRVVAMTGASQEHETIALNLATAVKTRLRGKDCQVFMSGMKVRVPLPQKGDKFYYPDLLVSCDPADRQHRYFKEKPRLIVEVLSPHTESFDRGDKFADYRRLDRLEEFVLIAQDKKRVEIFRRDENGRWYLEDSEEEDTFELTSIGLSCSLTELYEGVDFAALDRE